MTETPFTTQRFAAIVCAAGGTADLTVNFRDGDAESYEGLLALFESAGVEIHRTLREFPFGDYEAVEVSQDWPQPSLTILGPVGYQAPSPDDTVSLTNEARLALVPPPEDTPERTAILHVGPWSSTCSACGGNASMDETHHVHGGTGAMYTEGSSLSDTNGCGARFTKVEALFDTEAIREARALIEGTAGSLA